MSTVWVVSAVLAWAVIALLVAVVLSLLRQTAELRLRLDELDGGELFEAPEWDAAEGDPVPTATVPLLPGSAAVGAAGVVGAVPGGAGGAPGGGPGAAGVLGGIPGVANGGRASDPGPAGGERSPGPGLAGPGADRGSDVLELGGPRGRGTLLVYHSPGCSGCVGVEEALEAVRDEGAPVDLVSVLVLRGPDAARHLRRRPLPGVPSITVDALPRELQRPTTPSMLGISPDGIVAAIGRPDGAESLRALAARTAVARDVAGS